MNRPKRWLSVLLVLSMLLTVAVFATSVAAAGADYADDATAIAAGYSFRVEGKYYNNLVDCYNVVPEGGTIYMIADYTNNSTHETVGRSATAVKSFTIVGNSFTYSSNVTHGLHLYNSKVTIDGMNYLAATGNVSGLRVEHTAEVTLKNCTFEKTGASVNGWNTPVIVYGTLILDQGAVIKNSGEEAGDKSHALWLEGKDENEKVDASIVPTVILKAGSTLDAKHYAFSEATKSRIEVESHNVKLICSAGSGHSGDSWRSANKDSVVVMAGPTDADYSNDEVKASWKDLYEKLKLTWIDTPQVDENTIRSYRPEMKGISVRMNDGDYGLRFSTTISAEVTGFAAKLVERGIMRSFSYGTLIVRYEDIKELTDISLQALTAAGVTLLDVPANKGLQQHSDGSVTISTAMVNIKEKNYGVRFCAISYISYVYADETLGSMTVYAMPSVATSMEDAAWSALTDVSETLVSGCTNPIHSYWKLENGEYVLVDGDVYTRYSKAQQEALLAFTFANREED